MGAAAANKSSLPLASLLLGKSAKIAEPALADLGPAYEYNRPMTDAVGDRARAFAEAIKRAGIIDSADRAALTGLPEAKATFPRPGAIPGKNVWDKLSFVAGAAMVSQGITGYGWSGALTRSQIEPQLWPLIEQVIIKLRRNKVDVDNDGNFIGQQGGGIDMGHEYPLWNCAEIHAVNDLLRTARITGTKVQLGPDMVVYVMKGLNRGKTLQSIKACEYCREILASHGIQLRSGMEPIHVDSEFQRAISPNTGNGR